MAQQTVDVRHVTQRTACHGMSSTESMSCWRIPVTLHWTRRRPECALFPEWTTLPQVSAEFTTCIQINGAPKMSSGVEEWFFWYLFSVVSRPGEIQDKTLPFLVQEEDHGCASWPLRQGKIFDGKGKTEDSDNYVLPGYLRQGMGSMDRLYKTVSLSLSRRSGKIAIMRSRSNS